MSLIRQYSLGEDHTVRCRGGIDYFFVDAARGHAFPCGYRGSEDLGPYWQLELSKASTEVATCTKCDWECWRDPSALMELGRMAVGRPWSLVSRAISDRHYVKTWLEDLRYIRAYGYFSSRTPPNYDRLARFARPATP